MSENEAREMYRELEEFEAAHPELRDVFRQQGARAYGRAIRRILDEQEWPEVVYNDILDCEVIDA